MKQIVVFASGSGTNFQALIDAIESGQINARIRGLITNRSDIKSLERAAEHGIESKVLSPADFSNDSKYEKELEKTLKEWDADLIVLAGYLLKIPDNIIEQYRNRIINIHPSLLPKYGGKGFYGMKVHRAVIDNKETESGCTVHLVNEEYDQGPILAQKKVPVHPSDDAETLAKRILKQEHSLLPEVVGRLIEELNSKNDL